MTREEAIEWLEDEKEEYIAKLGTSTEAYDMAIEALGQMSETGEWLFNPDPRCGDFICSECLERNIVCTNYCPNCGAKMRDKYGTNNYSTKY